jgi:uncharacterized SAM-binding protein YcdF (DUF218 family)
MKLTESEVDGQAKIIWDYLLLHEQPEKCDAVFVLCSIDERVAEYGAQLFLDGFGTWLIFSGGVAHDEDLLKTSYDKSEAEHFADIAITKGVPANKIIVESQAQNTGQNVEFTYKLLKEKGLKLESFLLVQKPYMERRTFATFKKQWPDVDAKIFVTSPRISFEDYFNETNPKKLIINIMVGDLQRIREYPKLGFQIEQEIPDEVWAAYEKLVAAGFDKHLIAK